jgi:hypothetical protein
MIEGASPVPRGKTFFRIQGVWEAGSNSGEDDMCRNIKPLFNFDPPATDDEIRQASLQFVRKISGFTKPSSANELAFNQAVAAVSAVARDLLTGCPERLKGARSMKDLVFVSCASPRS